MSKLILENVRFAFVHVWEPKAFDDTGVKKYQVTVLIPKKDKKTIARIEAEIESQYEAGMSGMWKKTAPRGYESPLRDGDKERPDRPEFEGMMFFSAKSKTMVRPIYRNGDPVIDPNHFFSGCYGAVSVNFYPYNNNGSKGIAGGLNHIMVTDYDEDLFLGGRGTAASDFGDLIEK